MAAECYANNGSLYANTAATYVPCNITAVENGEHSSCCAIGDLCMTNGLCMEQQNEQKGANHYWRNGCTDKTWKDPACPNYCRGKARSHLDIEEPDHFNAFIFYCFDPTNDFCCAPQGTLEAGVTGRNTSCCNDDDLVFQAAAPVIEGTAAAALPRLTTTSSISAFTSSASTSRQPTSGTSMAAATTTAQSETATPTASAESSGMSSGAKAGLGVGVTLGVVAVLAIVGAVFLMRRRKANRHNNAILLSDSKANPPPYITYESAGTVRAELEGTMLPAEMHHASDKMGSTTSASKEISPSTPTKEDTITKYS
ncbi:uncharacterized protein N0V89_000943 [Didymosphaeria variabile]|uniref:Uncharacterized protein n=1 Tax=Didymosphaeria variabile TaxID=1932322 RepID=A0A9W9CGC3_9PLEO|nr:uncharacterized protein N0V89_000943 [Didymosphaeria variabile]KAJ4360381.1 hypothetical protein N0V89_000943 [Didymosphaeria variabile]